MKINIYPIVSCLHQKERINDETKKLLDDLILKSGHDFKIVDIDELYDSDLSLILIQSGGSEQHFLDNLSKLKPPFYLLTYGNNNSLAASLEILSYIKDNNLDGKVLHGSNEYLIKEINSLSFGTSIKKSRFGVIGRPSDWLISSNVNYEECLRKHNIELVDIPIDEVISGFFGMDEVEDNFNFKYDKAEIQKALKLHKVIENIKDKYNLNGVTIRCFDLLSTINTTACLSLAILNASNIVATCEGDIPTMISMHILNNVAKQTGFQVNPSRIDVENNTIVFAHCTLPLNMPVDYTLDTHFESGIGVAIRGKLRKEKITIFKLSRNLKDFYVTTGTIIENLNESNLCRSQVKVQVDENIEYFLTRPYGNHHVIIYGDYKDKIIEYMKK